MHNPVYGQSTYYFDLFGGLAPVFPGDIALARDPKETQTQTGLYLQDQIKAGPWIAVLGLRHDWGRPRACRDAEEERHSATTGSAAR